MSVGVPGPPGRGEAIEAAAEAVRDSRDSDRDAILAARRVLREAERAHDREVHATERRRRAEGTEEAAEAVATAHAERAGVAGAGPLLERVVGRLEADEEVLDMAAGVCTGHDGVLLATTRRVLFVSPRQTIDVPYDEIDAVRIRGRHFGARATFVTRDAKFVVSGLRPVRAAEIGDLVAERTGRSARR